jgi:hypothetical protein
MRDEEMLQKLLRLKQYETPGDDYFERFLDEFHARMARESRARHGVKDRFYAWLEELFPSPRLGWSAAAGGMMAVVAFAFVVSNNDRPLGGSGLVAKSPRSLSTEREIFAGVPQVESASSSLATTSPVAAEKTAPSPIIFPELIAPVSYSLSRSGDRVNLTAPGSFLRPGDLDNAFRLSQQGQAGSPETIFILDPNAPPLVPQD